MLDIVGEQEGLQFMKRLAAQDLYLREGKSLLTQLLAAGEFAILINNYVDVATKVKDSGAAIDWLPARNPIPASTHLVGIHARSLHPNAARLFVDFLLSKNGQMLLAGNLGKFPAHPAVESNLRRKVGGFKLYPLNPSMMSGFDRVSKLYETIFLKQR
jgi:iron(III) transport system substrate-binding protein